LEAKTLESSHHNAIKWRLSGEINLSLPKDDLIIHPQEIAKKHFDSTEEGWEVSKLVEDNTSPPHEKTHNTRT
jgi:hypothetical protein